MEITPAIIPKNFEEVCEKVGLVHSFVRAVQIDVVDGHFVPPVSWPIDDPEDTFSKIRSGEMSLPFFQKLTYEADLMVVKPEEIIGSFVEAGFERLIVHVESTGYLKEILEEWSPARDIGLAINIATPTEDVYPFVPQAGFIQFMGIETIGFQSQPFSEEVYKKISALRSKFPNVIIAVDGGVSLRNARELVRLGATRLAVGSALFGSDDIEKTIEKFKSLS